MIFEYSQAALATKRAVDLVANWKGLDLAADYYLDYEHLLSWNLAWPHQMLSPNQADCTVRIDVLLNCVTVMWANGLNSVRRELDVGLRGPIEHLETVQGWCQDSLLDYVTGKGAEADKFHADINKAINEVADELVDQLIYLAMDMSLLHSTRLLDYFHRSAETLRHRPHCLNNLSRCHPSRSHRSVDDVLRLLYYVHRFQN